MRQQIKKTQQLILAVVCNMYGLLYAMSSVPQQSFESSLSKSFTSQASGGSGTNVGFSIDPSTLSVKFNSPLAILNPTPLGEINFTLKLINTHADTLFSAKQHIGFNVPYIDHLEDNKYVLHMGNSTHPFQIKDKKSRIIPDKNWITQDSLTSDISFDYNKLPTFYLAQVAKDQFLLTLKDGTRYLFQILPNSSNTSRFRLVQIISNKGNSLIFTYQSLSDFPDEKLHQIYGEPRFHGPIDQKSTLALMALDYPANSKATVTTYNKEGQRIQNVLSIVENNYTGNDLNKIDATLTVKNPVNQSYQVNFNKLGDIISADMPTGQTFTATVTEPKTPNYFVVDDQQKAAPINSSYISALERNTKNDAVNSMNVSYGRVGQNNFGGNTVHCSLAVYESLLANRQQDWLMACGFSLPEGPDGYRYVNSIQMSFPVFSGSRTPNTTTLEKLSTYNALHLPVHKKIHLLDKSGTEQEIISESNTLYKLESATSYNALPLAYRKPVQAAQTLYNQKKYSLKGKAPVSLTQTKTMRYIQQGNFAGELLSSTDPSGVKTDYIYTNVKGEISNTSNNQTTKYTIQPSYINVPFEVDYSLLDFEGNRHLYRDQNTLLWMKKSESIPSLGKSIDLAFPVITKSQYLKDKEALYQSQQTYNQSPDNLLYGQLLTSNGINLGLGQKSPVSELSHIIGLWADDNMIQSLADNYQAPTLPTYGTDKYFKAISDNLFASQSVHTNLQKDAKNKEIKGMISVYNRFGALKKKYNPNTGAYITYEYDILNRPFIIRYFPAGKNELMIKKTFIYQLNKAPGQAGSIVYTIQETPKTGYNDETNIKKLQSEALTPNNETSILTTLDKKILQLAGYKSKRQYGPDHQLTHTFIQNADTSKFLLTSIHDYEGKKKSKLTKVSYDINNNPHFLSTEYQYNSRGKIAAKLNANGSADVFVYKTLNEDGSVLNRTIHYHLLPQDSKTHALENSLCFDPRNTNRWQKAYTKCKLAAISVSESPLEAITSGRDTFYKKKHTYHYTVALNPDESFVNQSGDLEKINSSAVQQAIKEANFTQALSSGVALDEVALNHIADLVKNSCLNTRSCSALSFTQQNYDYLGNVTTTKDLVHQINISTIYDKKVGVLPIAHSTAVKGQTIKTEYSHYNSLGYVDTVYLSADLDPAFDGISDYQPKQSLILHRSFKDGLGLLLHGTEHINQQAMSTLMYNDKSQLIKSEDPYGSVMTIVYDAIWQKPAHVNIKDAKGQIIYQIDIDYNDTGKIKSRTLWRQGKQQNSEDYQYNTLEQLTNHTSSYTLHDGSTVVRSVKPEYNKSFVTTSTSIYDGDNRLINTKTPSNIDAYFGHPLTINNTQGNVSVTRTYNPDLTLYSIEDNLIKKIFTYNDLHRVTDIVNQSLKDQNELSHYHYQYNRQGNIATKDLSITVDQTPVNTRYIYEYSDLSQLKSFQCVGKNGSLLGCPKASNGQHINQVNYQYDTDTPTKYSYLLNRLMRVDSQLFDLSQNKKTNPQSMHEIYHYKGSIPSQITELDYYQDSNLQHLEKSVQLQYNRQGNVNVYKVLDGNNGLMSQENFDYDPLANLTHIHQTHKNTKRDIFYRYTINQRQFEEHVPAADGVSAQQIITLGNEQTINKDTRYYLGLGSLMDGTYLSNLTDNQSTTGQYNGMEVTNQKLYTPFGYDSTIDQKDEHK